MEFTLFPWLFQRWFHVSKGILFIIIIYINNKRANDEHITHTKKNHLQNLLKILEIFYCGLKCYELKEFFHNITQKNIKYLIGEMITLYSFKYPIIYNLLDVCMWWRRLDLVKCLLMREWLVIRFCYKSFDVTGGCQWIEQKHNKRSIIYFSFVYLIKI